MERSNYHVVVVDDNRDLLEVLSSSLQDEFKVKAFTDPHLALNYVNEHSADAVVLDYHMPTRKGCEVFQELRKGRDVPVLFLTGDTDVNLKISSLGLGIGDFLQKPISMPELSAHLRNRISSYKKRNPTITTIKNLEVNLADPEVKLEGKSVILTPKEFKILSMLVTNPNTVIKKEDMVNSIWPNVKVEENNLDTHMSNLRKKLSGFQGNIKTIKCVGYVLRV